jgi:molecular chaperone IbpA
MVNVPFFDPFTFPNLAKSAIGFDSMLKKLNEVSENLPKIPAYPPYNIRKIDDSKYVIEIAVAGFGKQDLEIEMQEGVLTIRGHTINAEGNTEDYVFKGIADRAFTRKFTVADHVEVKNADLINGLLKIWLERFIPEEKKPKKIDISDTNDTTPKNKPGLLTE